jgi:hypothetical protein
MLRSREIWASSWRSSRMAAGTPSCLLNAAFDLNRFEASPNIQTSKPQIFRPADWTVQNLAKSRSSLRGLSFHHGGRFIPLYPSVILSLLQEGKIHSGLEFCPQRLVPSRTSRERHGTPHHKSWNSTPDILFGVWHHFALPSPLFICLRQFISIPGDATAQTIFS